jgi:hypothetical protein
VESATKGSDIGGPAAITAPFGAGAAVDRKRSSRVRYRGYGLIAADVTPALPGRQTTISVRALAQDGTVIDRFTLVRRAK